jgi:hypothetical protein
MTVYRAVILGFSLGAFGCGSDDAASPDEGAGGAPGMPECPPSTGPIDPAAMIDDFEDGDAALLPVAGRQSQWWVTGDGTVDATVSPPEGAAMPERILGGRCGSLYGMHVSGQGYTDWGAVLSVSMRYEDGPGEVAVDLSAYRGIRFFAKIGELHTAPLRVAFHDQGAHPNGGICDANSTEIGVQCWDSVRLFQFTFLLDENRSSRTRPAVIHSARSRAGATFATIKSDAY